MRFTIFILFLFIFSSCGNNPGDNFENKVAAQQSKGVQFLNMTFEEAQAKAKAENKLLMVDFYAVWCAPCKQMDKLVFKDETYGGFINENYISLKIDGEKGEGPELYDQFGLTGFPTVIIFNFGWSRN